jgi:peptidoglycan/xylan/chitin deacetylase (PgdA/CDA1 family)
VGGTAWDDGEIAATGQQNLGKNEMRIAAGCLIALSLCVPGAAWSQSAPAQPAAAAPPLPAAAAAPQAAPAAGPARAQAPQPARAPCNNPNALGVVRTVEIDTTGGPGFGFEHFKELDFLKEKEVVLTFDDGPWPGNTPAVLKALAEECTTGIFFEIGKHATYYPEIAKQVYAAGHTIGTHTWSHATLVDKKLSEDQRKEEIEKGISAVKWALGGISPAPFFRFPALQHPPEMVTYLGNRNIAMFSCDIDSFDFKYHDPKKVMNLIFKGLEKHGKGIILMHDFHKETAALLPEILKRLKAEGYKVVAMRAKAPVTSLPQYDEAVLKDSKLPTVSQRPLSSVVTEVSQ